MWITLGFVVDNFSHDYGEFDATGEGAALGTGPGVFDIGFWPGKASLAAPPKVQVAPLDCAVGGRALLSGRYEVEL